jgi:hypothetical protein
MPLPNNDVDFYLVIEGFGDRGPSFLETDIARQWLGRFVAPSSR